MIHYSAHNSVPLVYIIHQLNVHAFQSSFPKFHFNTILPFMARSPK